MITENIRADLRRQLLKAVHTKHLRASLLNEAVRRATPPRHQLSALTTLAMFDAAKQELAILLHTGDITETETHRFHPRSQP